MTSPHHTSMVLIAGFKAVKGVLLMLVGLVLLQLVHLEVATLFSKLLEAVHLNADSHILHALVLRVDALQPHSIRTIALVSMGYAGLLLIEGLGLWFERSWAAYLTVVSTSFFLPFELYEVIERLTWARLALLLVNFAIVVYLIRQLRRHTLQSSTQDSQIKIP